MKPEDVTTLGNIRAALDIEAQGLRLLSRSARSFGNKHVADELDNTARTLELQSDALDALCGKLVDQAVRGSFEATNNMVRAALVGVVSGPTK